MQTMRRTDTQLPVNQPLVFLDPASARIFALAQKVAVTSVPVLITGPTGCGKEILANVMHEASARASGPFVAVNCAAIPASLAEDILFGHEKGAFTGAASMKQGLFEQAHRGTLFLDEIGEMPLELQPKILRALQEKKITRIGGTASIDVDVRVVAATNVNLLQEVARGGFREDLYYRLSAFRFTMPALAERPLDIEPLALLMIQKYADCEDLPELTRAALNKLQRHRWPGNIRELENVIARAVILAEEGLILPDDIYFDSDELTMPEAEAPATVQTSAGIPVNSGATLPTSSLEVASQQFEARSIVSALLATSSRADAAERLGISERTLRHKLQKLRNEGFTVPRAYTRCRC